MAAGEGFKTFTTGEVLTAADVNGYLMQGINVFTNAANRDAEITSPQEGQFAYLKDTNVTTYYTGSAWVAASSGSLTYITGASFTTAATISMASGVFNSTYENYLVMLNITASSADQNMSIRVNNAGTPRTAANYYGGKVWRTTSTTSSGATSHNFASVRTSFPSVAHSIYVASPATSTVKTNWFSTGIGFPDGGSVGSDISTSACNYDVAEANDGLTFLVTGTLTGFYKVYGIANSQDYDD